MLEEQKKKGGEGVLMVFGKNTTNVTLGNIYVREFSGSCIISFSFFFSNNVIKA